MPFSHLEKADPQVIWDDAYLKTFVLENQTDMVFVKDEHFCFVYANAAFLELYAPEERDGIIGSTTIEKFSPEEAQVFLSEDRRAFREGRSEIVENHTNWQGRKLVLQTRKIVMQMKSGEKRLVGIATDITDLAQREERLVALNDTLKHYSHAIAHDLKNPISSLIAGLNIIEQDKNSQLGERASRVITTIREGAAGLTRYIEALLQDAASENSTPVFKEYDLNMLLKEVRFNLSALIETHNVTLSVARLPTMVVEPNRLRQLFQNLIENAVKFSDSNHPLITLHHRKENNLHIFQLNDNGPGIPAGIGSHAFSQYFASGDQSGLGLGLTMCQRIADLHGGELTIDDSVDSGFSIILTLPEDIPAQQPPD